MSFEPRSFEPFLFLYITERCQLRCHHCYLGDRLEEERLMPVAQIRQILRSLRIMYGQHKVYLLGGEPTLHPEIEDILQICKAESYEVVLTSNGLIPERVWPKLRPESIDSMSFSLDGGSREVHEAARGHNTFAPLVAAMQRAVGAGFHTRAIFTVTRVNIDDVENALALADMIGLDMLALHYFTPTGRGRANSQLQISPADWIRFWKNLPALAERYQVRLFVPPAFADPQDVNALRAAGYRGCTARNLERLAIFPDCRVYLCSTMFDLNAHFGTFEGERIVPVNPFGEPGELEIVSAVAPNCMRCDLAVGCGGGCPAYGRLGHTLSSLECDGTIIPICPLWSMPVLPEATPARMVSLR